MRRGCRSSVVSPQEKIAPTILRLRATEEFSSAVGSVLANSTPEKLQKIESRKPVLATALPNRFNVARTVNWKILTRSSDGGKRSRRISGISFSSKPTGTTWRPSLTSGRR